MNKHDKLIFYIDGASQGNPGPSGIGVVVCDSGGTVLENISEYLGENTNNFAEYSALIFALQEGLVRKANSVIINTDSELLVKQLNGEYKVKDEILKRLHSQAQRLIKGYVKVQVNHISRTENKGADKLATKAVDNNKTKKTTAQQATFTFENKR